MCSSLRWVVDKRRNRVCVAGLREPKSTGGLTTDVHLGLYVV